MTKKLKCWKKVKDDFPYRHGTWINKKKMERVRVISDIGFGTQRNMVVENLKKHNLSGFEVKKVEYEKNQKDALTKAKSYMKKHDKC